MGPPKSPEYQPYASLHVKTDGPGDARPTAHQVLQDSQMIGQLAGKTVLITGASAGLGVETARTLYEAGATLYLTARDMPKLDKTIEEIVSSAAATSGTTPRPQPIEMHLDSLASVRKGAEAFKTKSGGKLNLLITNAGVMACPYGKTQDGFETQIGTNHFAHFLLFHLLKPLLLASAKSSGTTSRVVSLSSAGHHLGGIRFDDLNWDKDGPAAYAKWQAYGQAKTANIYFANCVHRHYASQGLTAVSVHPGAIQTNLSRHLVPEDYKMFGDMEAFKKTRKSPEQGAATTVWAAVDPYFEDVANGGVYCADVGVGGPGRSGYAAHAYDEEAEERLWKLSYEAVGLPVAD